MPTPIDEHKNPDLAPLIKASQTVGSLLKKDDIVIYESTVYPGATEEVCVPILEQQSALIFNQDLFKDLSIGDKLKGIVKKIRPGNKLDITLEKIGYGNIEPNAQSILEFLENNQDGCLKLTDKSSPEDIKSVVQMSKKSFKKAIGTLYKQRRIRIEQDGIYLTT